MKHLVINADTWCSADGECTDDPRDATCPDCLRQAATYGAAAAMRYAAVEAGVTHDPELVRERDEAIRRVNAVNNELEQQGVFFCHDCLKLRKTTNRALGIGPTSWCDRCAPSGVV